MSLIGWPSQESAGQEPVSPEQDENTLRKRAEGVGWVFTMQSRGCWKG